MWHKLPSLDVGSSGSLGTNSARMSVPGGWLVATIAWTGDYSGGISAHQIFIVDPDHKWQLESEPAMQVSR